MKPHTLTAPRRRHCRCRVCRGRQVKAKHPDDYQRRIRCKHCGQFNTLIVDKWADNRGWRKYTCYCDGYHFPHRIRSEFCFENPHYGDHEERRLTAYGVMA